MLKEFFERKVTFLKAIVVLSVLSIIYYVTGYTEYLLGLNAAVVMLIIMHLVSPFSDKVCSIVTPKIKSILKGK